jgi:hypothetical protein
MIIQPVYAVQMFYKGRRFVYALEDPVSRTYVGNVCQHEVTVQLIDISQHNFGSQYAASEDIW